MKHRMTGKIVATTGLGVAVLAAAWVSSTGCGTTFKNLTKERTGNISVRFNNTTPYRASFSYGTYDAWDRTTPGTVTLQQLSVPPNSASTAATLPCRRNMAIASQGFYDRVILTKADETDTFKPDSFDITVHFSSAAADSAAAELPTAGTAPGREVLLGIDFSCADTLIFTFVEDPAVTGGFRIDFEVLLDDTQS